MSKTVTLAILQDGLWESDETLTVTLTNPAGTLSLGAQTNAEVVILDDDGIGWERTLSTPPLIAAGVVTFGADRFVALGDPGRVAVSADGFHWRRHELPAQSDIRAVAFGEGRFATVTDAGTMLTSTDGQAWTSQAAPSVVSGTQRLAAGNGSVVGIAAGNLWALPNGKERTVNPSAVASDLTFGRELFVAAGKSNAFTSATGSDWTSDPLPLPAGAGVSAVAYFSGQFVAVGWNAVQGKVLILTSPDGRVWSLAAIELPGGPDVDDLFGPMILFGNGPFLAVGSVIVTSPDRAHWDLQPVPALADITAGPWRRVTFGAGQYAATTDDGWLFTSDDGRVWTPRGPLPDSHISVRDLAIGPGIFAVIQGDWPASLFLSPDGATWRQSTLPHGLAPNSITFANGRFYAGAGTSDPWAWQDQGGAIFRSTPILHLGRREFVTPDSFRLSLSGEAGMKYAIEASSDLRTWEPVSQGTLVGSTGEFVDSDAARSNMRCYRVRGVRQP